MKKEDFVNAYIAAFLGAIAANEYVRNCQNGWPKDSEEQPVEDAQHLAYQAWYQISGEIDPEQG